MKKKALLMGFFVFGTTMAFSQQKVSVSPSKESPTKTPVSQERATPLSESSAKGNLSQSRSQNAEFQIRELENEIEINRSDKNYDLKTAEAKLAELRAGRSTESKAPHNEK